MQSMTSSKALPLGGHSTDAAGMPAHLLRGQLTRKKVLALALPIAVAEGLDAMTIGRMAEAAGISKAGLLGHYGSKEALQIATLEAGGAQFLEAVVRPAMAVAPGIDRVACVLGLWIDYIVDTQGGCLFASAAAEFDGRIGPVKSHIAQMIGNWIARLQGMLGEARECGQLVASTDLRAMAFRLHGYELSLNFHLQLLGDKSARKHARDAMRADLHAHATQSGRSALQQLWKAST
jgi:AcrR family transcriptional regulator